MTMQGFWSRIIGAFRRDVSVAPISTLGSMPSDIDFGVSVNNNSAMKLTAMYAGIRLVSENIASLPRRLVYYSGGALKYDDGNQSLALINVRPNQYTNAFSFWSTIVTWVKGWGNAYVIIKRDSAGVPVELHQVHPAGVRVAIVNGRKWYHVVVSETGLQDLNGDYPDSDVLHFMELTLDGIRGCNPIIYNAIAIGKGLAEEKFSGEFYRKGGNIRAVMETDGNLGDDEYKSFMRHFAESSDNYDTPLLEFGIKYKPLSVNPIAAQLIQSEVLSIQDVCRIVNVPPHMVAELSHATFANIEHQTIQFVQYSLRPIVKRIEVELENKLFGDGSGYDVKFVLDGLLRGDTTARAAYYHNAILDGYMSRNEVREMEGLERAEGLDKYLYPLNSAVVGEENSAEDKSAKGIGNSD